MTDIAVPDNQPYYEFHHNGTHYCVYCWLQEFDVAYRMCLAEVVPNGDGYGVHNVYVEDAFENDVNDEGGVIGFMNNRFIPKANEYLANNGGGEIPPFPENGSHVTQFNWIVENGLVYENGELKLVNV